MTPDLKSFDLILINSSGGKDSQAMLDYVARLIERAEASEGVDLKDRVIVVHADLGRVEWQGTPELAERQAANYGFRFEKVSRAKGDLLDQIEQRGMFPSSTARYCTSDQKRDQVAKLITRVTNEVYEGEQIRILNCMGLRAQESSARAKRAPISIDKRATNGKREVTEWLPILDWTEDRVWAAIRTSGVEHHWAYDAGMPRLSCCFCILASKSALIRAAQLNPELAEEYAAVEERINHKFKKDLSMREIILAAREQGQVDVEGWAA